MMSKIQYLDETARTWLETTTPDEDWCPEEGALGKERRHGRPSALLGWRYIRLTSLGCRRELEDNVRIYLLQSSRVNRDTEQPVLTVMRVVRCLRTEQRSPPESQ